MLVIRMQRTGRKGHAMFRVVVQDSRVTPTSGKLVAQLGSYDPHAKTVILDKEKTSFYLGHGAQPSDRAAYILQAEGVKLPSWVKASTTQSRTVRNADKRRSTRPVEEVVAEPAVVEEVAAPVEAAEPEAAPASEETVTVAEPKAEATAPEVAPVAEAEASDETPAA